MFSGISYLVSVDTATLCVPPTLPYLPCSTSDFCSPLIFIFSRTFSPCSASCAIKSSALSVSNNSGSLFLFPLPTLRLGLSCDFACLSSHTSYAFRVSFACFVSPSYTGLSFLKSSDFVDDVPKSTPNDSAPLDIASLNGLPALW